MSLHRNRSRHSVSWRRPGSRLWMRAMLSVRQLWISSTRRLWIVSIGRRKSWRKPIKSQVRKVVFLPLRELALRRGESWKTRLTTLKALSSLMVRSNIKRGSMRLISNGWRMLVRMLLTNTLRRLLPRVPALLPG